MSQTKSNQRRRKGDANKRDVFGRNASSLLSCLPSMDGIESIDLYSRDFENGYTPLHLTLKNGHLRKSYTLYKRWKDEMEYLMHKYGGHVMNQIDREGLKPLEVYCMELRNNLTEYPKYIRYGKEGQLEIERNDSSSEPCFSIQNSFMKLPLPVKSQTILREQGGSHILTLGSNVNYQLGTGTKDDRQNMFQFGINQLCPNIGIDSDNIRLKKIIMTRYHSIVLTSANEIFTCGNSSRGRLGNGVTDSPQLNFSKVLDLYECEVSMVVSSNHHSLVLSEDSKIFSWGWNGYGQLGYSTNNKSTEDKVLEKICGSIPRRVHFFDDKEITMIACSKVHSCAVSKNGTVYLWGLNLGQMGGTRPSHLTPDVEYEGQNGYIINIPVSIKLSHLSIQQIICTDFATFIRSSNNALHVYSNYMTRTFKIPLPRAKTFKEVDAFAHFAPREVPSEVIDMKCSNVFGNNICFKYSCGRVGIISIRNETPSMWSKFTNSLPVTICWLPNIETKRCLDMAVSAKGDLLITTVGSDVFTCTGNNFIVEQIHSKKLVSGRTISVSCDPSFGSFAILKDERFDVPILYPKDSLFYDFSQYSPLSNTTRNPKNTIWGFTNNIEFKLSNYITNFENNDQHDEPTNGPKKSFERLPFSNYLSDSNMVHDSEYYYDIIFLDNTGKELCRSHKLIWLSRCPKFKYFMINERQFTSRDGLIHLSLLSNLKEGKWIIEANSEQLSQTDLSLTLKRIIHFLYTDEKPEGHCISKILFDLMDSSYHLTKLPFTLKRLLETCLLDQKNPDSVDVLLKLKDGTIPCHSLVLSSRCAFFQTCLSQEWRNVNECGQIIVQMDKNENASFFNMSLIIKYIYGIPYHEIFSSIRFEQEVEYAQFYLDILMLCDELNLECFKNYVEGVTVRYINGETVVPILVNAVNSSSRLLALCCCWYLCLHIGLLFIKENIDIIEQCFDDDLWTLLEEVLNTLKSKEKQKDQASWYDDNSVDWFTLFQTNIKEFNEIFMSAKTAFIPVIDVKWDITEGSKAKTARKSNRRRSSNHSINNCQILSGPAIGGTDFMSTRKTSITSISESKVMWNTNEMIGDTEAIIDTEEFIEVVKKTKRRSSIPVSPVDLVKPAEPESKVVIHKPKENTNGSLPSLISDGRKSASPPPGVNANDTSNSKITGSFKKQSQKQRRKQLNQNVNEEEIRASKKPVWGNTAFNSPTPNPSANGRKSLPSLYDNGSTAELIQTKKERKKMAWNNITNTEFISHGNLSGITPYVHKASMVKSLISTVAEPYDSNQTQSKPKPKLSLEERVAAQEFEKWFAEESKKVQKQLKNDKNKARDEMQVMYNAANNLPDFITGPSDEPTTSKKGRKLKLKFQNKNKGDNLIKTLQ